MKRLIAFFTAVTSMTAMVCLTGAAANKHLPLGWYIGLMAILTVVLQLCGNYIEKHFVNGEWI